MDQALYDIACCRLDKMVSVDRFQLMFTVHRCPCSFDKTKRVREDGGRGVVGLSLSLDVGMPLSDL